MDNYTLLHYAASLDDAVSFLLGLGADPRAHARTNIDDCETRLELAERYGMNRAAKILDAAFRA